MVDNDLEPGDDDLEPGPDFRKVRDPRSRRPSGPPKRVSQVLRSYNEDRAFSIRRPTEEESLQVKSELSSAVYYLNRWEDYDVRVRPYITEHYEIDGIEYTADEVTGEDLRRAASQGKTVKHYYKTNFWVRPPEERGFRRMSRADIERAHEKSAEVRGVSYPKGRTSGRPRRTVAKMPDDLPAVVPPARPVITSRPSSRSVVGWRVLLSQGTHCGLPVTNGPVTIRSVTRGPCPEISGDSQNYLEVYRFNSKIMSVRILRKCHSACKLSPVPLGTHRFGRGEDRCTMNWSPFGGLTTGRGPTLRTLTSRRMSRPSMR